jgi:hypothetical protein
MGIGMGKKDRLSCLEKRDLLNQTAASVETLLHWAERSLQEGYVHDAVNFYIKAGATEALKGLFERSRDEGDFFLFRRLCLATGHEPGAEEWLALAGKAEELGKVAFAAEAYRAAGAEDQVERLLSLLQQA